MRVDERLLYRHIGWKIKKKRNEIGLSQAQLGEAVNVNRVSITNIEAGNQKLPIHLLYNICQVLGVESPSEMLPTISEATTSPVLEKINVRGKILQVEQELASAILKHQKKVRSARSSIS